jgi:hypothetical protein
MMVVRVESMGVQMPYMSLKKFMELTRKLTDGSI